MVDGEWVRMTGEIVGEIVEVNNCLRINSADEDTSYLIIWPPHYTTIVENGSIQILDHTGQIIALVGEKVHLGGGGTATLEHLSVPEQLLQEIPPECTGPYWVSGGIIARLNNLSVTPTATISPTEPATTPTSVVVESAVEIETWAEYTNTVYGFRFRYPSSWGLIERPNTVAITDQAANVLRIRFRRLDEEIELNQYGGAAGDFVSRGAVVFLGKEVEKVALVFRGVDKQIHYNRTGEINRGDLSFTLALVNNRQYDQAQAVVPDEVQALADEVLTTFEWIE